MPTYLYFNNSRGHDHTRYGAEAFFDLDMSVGQERQQFQKIAPHLNGGQECIVATYASRRHDEVIFKKYRLKRWNARKDPAKRGAQDADVCNIVFRGDHRGTETTLKRDAATRDLYAPLFNRNGEFRRQSAIVATVR